MTHASVFSGIGGPEVAAAMLGWENLFHCEINPFGRRVLEYWFPESKSYEDITNTDFREWRGKVDVLTGGFPCQPFSYAGQRRGAEDDRYLWPSMFRCIDEVQPTWVIAENVAGITTMVEQGEVVGVAAQASLFEEDNDIRRYELRETFTLERICNDLGQHGYDVQPILIPACSVGAPHRRDRVFIIARRVEAVSEDTMHGGQLHRQNEEQQGGQLRFEQPEDCSERQKQSGGRGGEDGGKRDASDTYNGHGEERRIMRGGVGKEDSRRSARGFADDHVQDRKAVRTSSDTEHQRQVWSEHEGQPRPEEGIPSRSSSGDGRERTTSSDTLGGGEGTPGEGGGLKDNRSNTNQQPSEWRAETQWPDRFYAILRPSADSTDARLQHGHQSGGESGKAGTIQGQGSRTIGDVYAQADGNRGETTEAYRNGCAGNGRWEHFPSVSPVHRGNDGISVPLDHLTISFGKWRTESLKAYGNAIVPQVMYEIFRAIERVNDNDNQNI